MIHTKYGGLVPEKFIAKKNIHIYMCIIISISINIDIHRGKRIDININRQIYIQISMATDLHSKNGMFPVIIKDRCGNGP